MSPTFRAALVFLTLLFTARLDAAPLLAEQPSAPILAWLNEPSLADWKGLARFDRVFTRLEFEARLSGIFAPFGGMNPYLSIDDRAVAIFGSEARNTAPWVVIRFATPNTGRASSPVSFRTPAEFLHSQAANAGRPLAGLRIAIDPADIGGRWAAMEDRSVDFPGYGRINEGDINLTVAFLLRARLTELGAEVFLVRDRQEPVLALQAPLLLSQIRQALNQRPSYLPGSFYERVKEYRLDDPKQFEAATGLLFTKTLETHARARLVRQLFQPDLTIVLQHNATAESIKGGLTKTNRNIFFVNGAYSNEELRQASQRFRLLTQIFENVTPVEAQVASAISRHFKARTNYSPVEYGNSATTRLVVQNNPYVVARNLALNRNHEGPVVVTEPYFMNQADTLVRLLAGDFVGERVIAGKRYTSIYREYAECVADGLVDAYARSSTPTRRGVPQRPRVIVRE